MIHAIQTRETAFDTQYQVITWRDKRHLELAKSGHQNITSRIIKSKDFPGYSTAILTYKPKAQ